ncbi:hypothetical protein GOP47_0005363 [Adiantum capillus-veneris]|uniref:SCP domain-containing protein n=1 Tax=Adiantum capillus-veneris TaxID=13818 RepID=A0A9D4ZLI0_ADICA|nr:hypothetical protein GOP47_0005363 [Adiantum capillus-veneris]
MRRSLLLLLLCTIAFEGICRPCYGYFEDDSARVAQDFVEVQNEARAVVGLPPLQWNTQLANYARWWAAQNAIYGDCRLRHSGGPYGENIFWGNGKDWSPYDAASDWADEKRWYNYWANSCLFYDACGHYTQIVWRDTRYVGCARVTCNDGNIFMTCNYYPPGNYIGQRPY